MLLLKQTWNVAYMYMQYSVNCHIVCIFIVLVYCILILHSKGEEVYCVTLVCLSACFFVGSLQISVSFFQELLIANALNFKTLFVLVCCIVGSKFVPIRCELFVK